MPRLCALMLCLLLSLCACAAAPAAQPSVPPSAPTHDAAQGTSPLSVDEQLACIARQLGDLLDRVGFTPERLMLSDLDGNAQIELLLCDSEFAAFECSADGALLPLAHINDDSIGCPALRCDQPMSVLLDADGTRHFILGSCVACGDTDRFFETDYTLCAGVLSAVPLRSYVYDYERGETTAYTCGADAADYAAYARATDALCAQEPCVPQALFLGGMTCGALLPLSVDERSAALADVWARFRIDDGAAIPRWQELSGTWRISGGEVEGSEFAIEPNAAAAKLVFHDGAADYIDVDGARCRYDMPTALHFAPTYQNDFWYIELPDTDVFHCPTLTLTEDGRVCFMARLMYDAHDYASVVWYFEKEI